MLIPERYFKTISFFQVTIQPSTSATQDQNYIEEIVRYIHLNPVRAGICKALQELEYYPWSGHAAVCGTIPNDFQDIVPVLRRFGKTDLQSRKKLRWFLAEGLKTTATDTVIETIRKSNTGASDIHRTGCWVIGDQSVEEFEKRLGDNLYKLWNRMSSGSYFPLPVRLCDIPKGDGKKKTLGIPTVSDRIAQAVGKRYVEPKVEPLFHPDSYGYRPGKSAKEAVGVARQRCWRYNWVIDVDIKGFFDNIDHDLMPTIVRKHTIEKWLLLYIERWLKAPAEDRQGKVSERGKGTPQGGVISPLLANLFLHEACDQWMEEHSNLTQTAKALGLLPSALSRKLKNLGIPVSRTDC